MNSIRNRKEANIYYKKINDLIDEMIESNKMKANEVHKWMKKNWKSFLMENDMGDIDNIKKILEDILDHRLHMEKDGVLTYEKFMLRESFEMEDQPSVDHEKVIADVFSSSLGHIDLINSDLRIYSINDFGKKKWCIILSDSEIKKYENIVIEDLVKFTLSKKLTINEYEGIKLKTPIVVSLNVISNEEEIKKIIESKDLGIEEIIMSQIMNSESLPSKLKDKKLIIFKKLSGWTIFKFTKKM